MSKFNQRTPGPCVVQSKSLSKPEMIESVDESTIERAVEVLRSGQLVAFPTETVYGLGADAGNPQALARLYAAKGRPANHPVIVHIAEPAMLERWAVNVPDSAYTLAQAFWPGPLTLVLPRCTHVLDQVTGGQETVALRIPSHPVALALLRSFDGGLAAPSANSFGKLSPTKAEDVERDLGSAVAMILDGGACQVGIESTIVDITGDEARVLRPGMISQPSIERVLGKKLAANDSNTHNITVRVPGSHVSHYAPSTPLQVIPAEGLTTAIGRFKQTAVLAFADPGNNHPSGLWHKASRDPAVYARELYAVLRSFDRLQPEWIVVEQPPDGPEWQGVRDRLLRAASAS